MDNFFQGSGVNVLLWLINTLLGIAMFFLRSRQALYEKMVQKDIERLDARNREMETELKEYRNILETRLQEITRSIYELIKSNERVQQENNNLSKSITSMDQYMKSVFQTVVQMLGNAGQKGE